MTKILIIIRDKLLTLSIGTWILLFILLALISDSIEDATGIDDGYIKTALYLLFFGMNFISEKLIGIEYPDRIHIFRPFFSRKKTWRSMSMENYIFLGLLIFGGLGAIITTLIGDRTLFGLFLLFLLLMIVSGLVIATKGLSEI